jgi:pimeloyl-ACP methyl ester carboxylesterase
MNVRKLDERELHFHIDAPGRPGKLFLRYLAPLMGDKGVVLYIHGATFPSALSIAHRFDGQSWRDDLANHGFHVWALDFLGFGYSDRYAEMAYPSEASKPLGRAVDAGPQVVAALDLIFAHHGGRRVSLVAHSWGSMAAGRAAIERAGQVDRIVLFAPISYRSSDQPAPRLPAWKSVTLEEQWTRFNADTPRGEQPVLLERHFSEWGERYLDTDPESRTHVPPAVKVPLGPTQEIYEAWAGKLAYDPGAVAAPIAIIRGAWDSLCTDADAAWLFNAFVRSPLKRDVKLSRGGHLMHLEEGRVELYRTSREFLQG